MKGGVRRAQLLFMFVTAAASGSRVTAQSSLAVPGLGTSATETSRYQALGIRTGGFTFYPSVKASVAYDDNIFSRSQRIGDEFVTIHPQLAARSNWSRHRLDVDLDGTLARYRRVTRENSGQYSARATGALDVTRTLKLTADALYAHQVEPRGTEGDIFATGKPLAFRHASLRLGAQDEFGRLRLTTSGTLESYRYGDMRLSGGGGSIGARDYDSRSGALRLGYQIGPRLIAFVSGSANRSSYLRRAPGGLNRNSSGFAVLGGVSFGLTDLLTGEAAIGYLQQNFAGSQFADDHGINYSGSLHWRPTPLITVTATIGRSVERTLLLNAAGLIQSAANAEVAYEVRRNWILRLTGRYVDSQYQGLDRRDRRFSEGATVSYLANEYVAFSLSADHRHQGSEGITRRIYTGNTIRFGVTLQR